jgi:hypothetical protein
MNPIVLAREFDVCVSMNDFVSWPDGNDGEFVANVDLQGVIGALGIDLDIGDLYVRYFKNTQLGSGDVHVFRSPANESNIFVVDLYRELTEQLDLVAFSIRCDETCCQTVLKHLRQFFDRASCQVAFEQLGYSQRLRARLDESQ